MAALMVGQHIKDALSPVVFLVAVVGPVAVALGFCEGCAPREQQTVVQNVENAAAVAQYDLELQRCQVEAEKVPRAQAFAAYIECEKAVSRHLCLESADLRREWRRCAEVSP